MYERAECCPYAGFFLIFSPCHSHSQLTVTRLYSLLCGLYFELLRRASASVRSFFFPFGREKKSFFMLVWLTIGHFWCSVVTSVIFISNVSDFQKYPKMLKDVKNPKISKIKKYQNIFFCKKKMLFSQFCQLKRLVFDQSSPVQPASPAVVH